MKRSNSIRNPSPTMRLLANRNAQAILMPLVLLTAVAVANDEPAEAAKHRSNSLPPNTTVDGSVERNGDLQRITTLSSMQFYTHFALIQKMLTQQWDEETFKKFSLYDGMNLKMMQVYEKQLKEHKTWGPFLKMKNALHREVYDDLKPLIRKKRMGEELTAADVEKLMEVDKLIFEKTIK